MILSQPLSDCSGVWANPPMPAMLHRFVIWPSCSPAWATAAATDCSSVTSQRNAMARPPASAASVLISVATNSIASVATSRQATAAPSAANRRAVARPMPEPAPVTSATAAGVAAGGDRLGGRPPVGIGLPDSGGGAHARSFSSVSPVEPLPSTPAPGPRLRSRPARRSSAAAAASAASRCGSTFIIGVRGSSSTTTSASGAL